MRKLTFFKKYPNKIKLICAFVAAKIISDDTTARQTRPSIPSLEEFQNTGYQVILFDSLILSTTVTIFTKA